MEKPAYSLKPEDILEIAIRRRWFILLPLCLSTIIGLYFTFTIPKFYESQTMILVEPQKVPRDYVRSVVTEESGSRLSTITQQIMSRTNLERIISEFNLFNDESNKSMFMEDKIEGLRNSIKVDVKRDRRGSDAFSLSFRGTNPQMVMKVTNALAMYFIDANIKERESSAVGTSSFLAAELENNRVRLNELETALKEFRQEYMGELPEQLGSNLTILQRLQEQLNAKEDNLRSIRLNLSLIDKQEEEGRWQSILQNEGDRSNAIGDSLNPEVLREQLTDLLTRYTERHPDVMNLKTKIAELEARQKVANGKASSESQNNFVQPSLNRPASISRQRAEFFKEKAALEADIIEINQQLQMYQQRIENTPKREQDLISLKRDYDNLNELYQSLLTRKLEAEMSVSLERKQKGEQFQIIDYARLPQKPVAPDLKKIFILSIAAGLGLSGVIIFLLEFIKNVIRKPEDVETSLNLPVIASIPFIMTRRDIFKRRIELSLCGIFSLCTVFVIGIFSFATITGTEKTIELIKKYLSL